MNIDISKETIEKAVSDAIVQSSIGDKIKAGVLDALSKGYENPIDKAIQKCIGDIAIATIKDQYKDMITKAVNDRLTQELVDKFADKFWQKIIEGSWDRY
jgi:uncharacterized protein (UPF0297 family)